MLIEILLLENVSFQREEENDLQRQVLCKIVEYLNENRDVYF